jgi:hypothetical protein
MTMLPRRDQMFHRLADTEMSAGPLSYDRHAGTVEAVISMGSPVERPYGTEVLRIAPDAVDLSRLREGGIPLLDHHQQTGINAMLGRLTDAWFERGAWSVGSNSMKRRKAKKPKEWSLVARSLASVRVIASISG